MTTAFPGSIDTFTNPVSSDPLDSVTVPHASQHANINDAVEAIETAIGTTGAPVLAPLTSPTFTGTPTLPTGTIATTQTAADSSTKVATTAFVTTADNLKANLASPTFTGTVTIPSGASIDGFAPLASPTFTGTPTLPTGTVATTQTLADNSTKVATTAFVIANAPTAASNYNKAVSGFSYQSVGNMVTAAAGTPTQNTTTYIPTFVVSTTTYDRISIKSNAIAVVQNVRLGIYSDTNGKPDALVLDAGTVSVNASNTLFSITISQSLTPGRYYLAACVQNVVGASSYYWPGTLTNDIFVFGAPGEIGFTPTIGWIQTGVTGAFTTAGTLTASSSLFLMSLRAA